MWAKLSECGSEQRCGWLKARFGLSSQVIPGILWRMFEDEDPARAQRVMDAMVKMKKIDIDALHKACARRAGYALAIAASTEHRTSAHRAIVAPVADLRRL